MKRRHEKPLRRRNPSGKIVWVARWTDRNGKRQSAGTYEQRGPCKTPREDGDCCAQHAIDAAYDRHYNAPVGPQRRVTVGEYRDDQWFQRHPRRPRTERSYGHRVDAMLNVELSGLKLRDWPMDDVRPREAHDLVDVMLRKQGRAASGASTIIATLSAMWKDAIADDAASYNPFRDVAVRAADPRVSKPPRRVRVYTFEQMHAVAANAPGVYGQAMVRMLSDAGLRLGEMLPLERADLRLNGCQDPECRAGDVPHVHVHQTAYDGRVEEGTKTTRGEAVAGRVAPVAPSLEAILRGLPPRLDTRLLFPSPRGKVLQNRCFYKDVWYPARKAVPGMGLARPHEFRHTWVSRMRAAAIDPADVANAAGHTLETANAKYVHSLGQSFEAMRRAVG